jgi:hypothetical protein
MSKNGKQVNGGGEHVIVACKLPNGIILQLCEWTERTESGLGGIRTYKVWEKRGDKYVVRGVTIPFGTVPTYAMAGGYALTSGIPRDFWEKWLEQNKDNQVVLSGLLFAHASQDDAEAQAEEGKAELTGMEPLALSMDPEVPSTDHRLKNVRFSGGSSVMTVTAGRK